MTINDRSLVSADNKNKVRADILKGNDYDNFILRWGYIMLCEKCKKNEAKIKFN